MAETAGPDLTALHLNRIVGPPGRAETEILPGISAQTGPKLLDIFHLTLSSAAGGGAVEGNIYIII